MSSKPPASSAGPPRPNFLHRVSHHIRRYSSLHLSLANLKRIAFAISLLSCLSAGSIMLFSLFSTALHEIVGLTYFQINFIAAMSSIGMYLCLPGLGYLGDCYGPAVLLLLLIWFFCPSYFFNSVLVARLQQLPGSSYDQVPSSYVYGFATAFFFIGLATSSLYFASVITCAKIYPDHKGLAISLPITCYGLSSLFGSQLMKMAYFKHDGSSYLDLHKAFNFFGVLYIIMGILNFVSNSIVIVEQDVLFAAPSLPDETTPLVSLAADDEDDSNSLLPQRSLVEPQHHHQRYIQFLHDKSAWILLVATALNLGPLESYQVNLGSILKNSTYHTDLSNQVSIIATSSTISRLVLGGLSDYISSDKRAYPICRVWLIVLVLVVGAVGQVANMYISEDNEQWYYIISILNGFSYGGLFTVLPTIVASIWGIDMMGSTWGSFMVAPAIGSVGYSLFYGKQIDSNCVNGGASCLSEYFNVTGVSMACSLVLVVAVWKLIWAKRGFALF
ncbi:monocarboxylate permease [Suhomyces tanzawaensis NRRL Y-17324]|uniref:Probable transporter MCH1 n=1 Tax=Suhomyces tanzawaensis NRRL Y-17324 TaxID=984487 RepID=A0A1E4SMI7_9ASCO|nr:monocarboxylate permease [Suhomyces tanzawaensis NRRL Y-17324]ODV80731.1 monocarboxylate permease [Suhomyces tanzawaensis NRRL Y-17324]